VDKDAPELKEIETLVYFEDFHEYMTMSSVEIDAAYEALSQPGFVASHERDESTALFLDVKKKEQGRGQRRGFPLTARKKGAPMIMEPLVYLSVTATTLSSNLAHLLNGLFHASEPV